MNLSLSLSVSLYIYTHTLNILLRVSNPRMGFLGFEPSHDLLGCRGISALLAREYSRIRDMLGILDFKCSRRLEMIDILCTLELEPLSAGSRILAKTRYILCILELAYTNIFMNT